MNNEFVDLKRKFLGITKTDEHDDIWGDHLEYLLKYKGIGWGKLMTERVAVILGEPGVGKTMEFKEQSKLLKKQDKYAFFINIQDLASEDFSLALESQDDISRFKKWKTGDEKAYFFLDSLDEARLKSSSVRGFIKNRKI